MSQDQHTDLSRNGTESSTFYNVTIAVNCTPQLSIVATRLTFFQTSYVLLVASAFAAVAKGLVIYCAWRIFRRNHIYTHVLMLMTTVADLFLVG